MDGLKEKYDIEETIENMMKIFDLNHYEAMLYVKRKERKSDGARTRSCKVILSTLVQYIEQGIGMIG